MVKCINTRSLGLHKRVLTNGKLLNSILNIVVPVSPPLFLPRGLSSSTAAFNTLSAQERGCGQDRGMKSSLLITIHQAYTHKWWYILQTGTFVHRIWGMIFLDWKNAYHNALYLTWPYISIWPMQRLFPFPWYVLIISMHYILRNML